MKSKIVTAAVTVAMLSGNASAEENGWASLGGILQKACSAANGNVAGMTFNTGQFGEKLQWLCQLQNIHGFINNNLLNGDWEGFAKDVAGKYLGQLANYVGGQMGSMDGVNATINQLNQAMQKDYKTFRKTLYGTALQTFQEQASLNAGASPGSVGAMSDQVLSKNPTFALADAVAHASDALSATQGVQNAYKAQKIQQEANKALESNTAQAMSTATNVIGTLTKEGLVDKYTRDAQTAVSAREVNEVLVKVTGEAMKQDATMSVALLNQLSEVAQQQVMTNTQLMMQRQAQEKEIANKQEQVRAAVEQEVAANQQEADYYQSEMDTAYDSLSNILNSDIQIDPVGK